MKKTVYAAALAAVLALAATGCGSSAANSGTSAQSTTPAVTSSAAATSSTAPAASGTTANADSQGAGQESMSDSNTPDVELDDSLVELTGSEVAEIEAGGARAE